MGVQRCVEQSRSPHCVSTVDVQTDCSFTLQPRPRQQQLVGNNENLNTVRAWFSGGESKQSGTIGAIPSVSLPLMGMKAFQAGG